MFLFTIISHWPSWNELAPRHHQQVFVTEFAEVESEVRHRHQHEVRSHLLLLPPLLCDAHRLGKGVHRVEQNVLTGNAHQILFVFREADRVDWLPLGSNIGLLCEVEVEGSHCCSALHVVDCHPAVGLHHHDEDA